MPPTEPSHLSDEKFLNIARMCGGAAFLVLAALFLSSTGLGGRFLSAAVATYTYASGSKINMDAVPSSIYAGNSSYVSWTNSSTTPNTCSVSASPTIDTTRPPGEILYSTVNTPNNLGYASFAKIGNSIFTFGGNSGGATGYIYAASTSNPTVWTQMNGSLPVGNYAAITATVGASVYIFGGYNGGGWVNQIYAASTSAPTVWKTMSGTLPVATGAGEIIQTTDNLYILNGVSNKIFAASTTNPNVWWDTGKTFPVGSAYGASIVSVGSTIYLYGGRVNNGGSYNTHIYSADVSDPTTWTDTGASIPTANGSQGFEFAELQVVGNYIYIYGGNNNGTAVLVASTLDPSNVIDTGWTTVNNMQAGTSVVLNSNQVYIFNAGGQPYIYTNVVNDPTWWAELEGVRYMPGNIAAAAITVIGDNIYTFGGQSGYDNQFTNAIYAASTSNATTWTAYATSTPGTLGFQQLAVVGDSMYLYGGWDGKVAKNVIYAASTSKPYSWYNTGKTLPGILSHSQLAIVGDNIYLFGGNTNSSCGGSVCSPQESNVIYAASTSNPTKWIDTKQKLPVYLDSSQLVITGPNMYLIGGLSTTTSSCGGSCVTTNWNIPTKNIYTASTTNPTRWVQLTSGGSAVTLPANRYWGSAVVLGSRLYYMGGKDTYGNNSPSTGGSCGGSCDTGNTTIYSIPIQNGRLKVGFGGGWATAGYTLGQPVWGAQVTQIGNELYFFGGGDGRNSAYSSDDLIMVAAATSTQPFASYSMPPWITDGGTNGGSTWRTITQSTTYTLQCKDLTSTTGSVQQTVNVFPSPTLSLTEQTVNGTSTVAWSAQNVSACTIAGTGIPSQSTTTQGTLLVYTGTGSTDATTTLTCTTPLPSTVKKSVVSKNGWFYAIIKGLPSYGASFGQDAYQNTSNRVINGWPAALACSYPPVDGSESWCATNSYGTTFGMFSAYQSNKFNNGSSQYFTSRSSTSQHVLDKWDNSWTSVLTNIGSQTLSVPPNTPVTLEWGCQQLQREYFEDACGLFGTSRCTATYYGYSDNSNNIGLFDVSSTTNFATTSLRGFTTVMSPAAGNSNTYYLQCKRTSNGVLGPVMSRTIFSSNGTASAPTSTITADQTTIDNGYTMLAGGTAVITANYGFDVVNEGVNGLQATAIYGNDQKTTVPCANVVPLSASCDQQADVQKVYTFSTTTPGVYNFYAALRTSQYTKTNPMDSYSSVQITVLPSTPNLSIVSTSDGAEPATNGSFRLQIDATQAADLPIHYTVSGSASATTSADYDALSGTATITAGQTYVDVPIVVSGHDDSVNEGPETVVITVTSDPGYLGTPSATINITDNDSSSVPTGPYTACSSGSCNLKIAPASVRKNGSATVSWSLTGLTTGANGNPGDSCTITSSPNVLATGCGGSYAACTSTFSGSSVVNNISQATVFTLTCKAPDNSMPVAPVSKTVTIIPGFQEI